jgi:hypothetical protein
MYQKNGKSVSLEEVQAAAEALSMSVEEWASEYGWSQGEGEPGKTGDSVVETATVESVPMTAAGDSSSADTSLGQSDLNEYLLTVDDIRGQESVVAKNLKQILSEVGLNAKEATAGSNAIEIVSYDKSVGSLERMARFFSKDKLEQNFGEVFNIGKRNNINSDEELQIEVDRMNEYILANGNANYLNEARERGAGDKKNEIDNLIGKDDRDDEEVKDELVGSKADEFEKIKDQRSALATSALSGQELFAAQEKLKLTPQKEKEYNTWLDTGIVPEQSDEAVGEYRAQSDNARRKRIFSEEATKLSEKDRLDVAALQVNEARLAEEEAKTLEPKLEEYEVLKEALNTDIDKYTANGTYPSEEELTQFRERETDLLTRREELIEAETRLKPILTNAPIAISNLLADHNRMAQLSSTFGDMGVKGAYHLTQLASLTDSMISGRNDYEVGLDKVKDNFQGALEDNEGTMGSYQEGVAFGEINSLRDAARWSAGTSIQAIPSLSLAATGSFAMPLFYLSGAGGKAAETALAEYKAAERLVKNKEYLANNLELDIDTRAAIDAEMQQDADLLAIPDWKNLTAAAFAGIFEVAFEKFGTMRLLKGISKATARIPLDGIRAASLDAATVWAKSAGSEGGTEALTEFANNAMDIYLLGEEKNLFEGTVEAFAGGALVGFGLSTIKGGGMVAEAWSSAAATKEEQGKLRNIVDKLRELTGVKDLNNLLDPNVPLPKQTPEVQQLIDELMDEGKAIKNSIINRLGVDLTIEDLYDVEVANMGMRKINAQMEAAIKSGTSSEKLAAIKKELESRFNALAKTREEILTSEDGRRMGKKINSALNINFESTEAYKQYTEAQQKLALGRAIQSFDSQGNREKQSAFRQAREKLGDEATNEQVRTEAIVQHKQAADKKTLAKGKESVRNYIDSREGLDINIVSVQTDAEAIAALTEAGITGETLKTALEAIKNGTFNGIENAEGTVIVHETNAIKNGKVGVYSHELLHAVANSKLSESDQSKVGDELLSFLEVNYPGLTVRLNQALEPYKGKPNYSKEVINAFSDLLSGGEVIDDTILQKMKSVFNKMFKGTDLKLDDAESTFYFVRDFNKVAQFGNPFVYVKSKGGDNKEKSESKASLANKPTVLESINALVPADVTTKAEFQNRKVFNAVYAATEPGGAISNYVRSKSESKEVADKAMESVVDRLINYDPAAVRKKANGDPITFGEFIFANTNFGKLDARKSLAIEAKETARKVSIDSEQAKEIADKDTTTDSRDSGKPRRMNLLTRGIVSAEAISKATKVVESAVGALKVPFNKQTSLNVTVKPYIAALKKGFADKALVKAVAQDMGNGGDLKSWMRKHKAAILDNMTTTYLIGAFPAAIQKQVKGTNTFTSDWAGKEIQREKTTTGNAGKTSGAFMVRRLPNASSKISDAEFVGMLFDSKGVIKPGKKPSLAKAIAEEIGFDILSAEIQKPDGQIAEAFKDNQEALGVVMMENTMATMQKDAERGTAKLSISPELLEAFPSLFYNSIKGGDKDVFDSYYNDLSKQDQEEWERLSKPLINSIEDDIKVRKEFIKVLENPDFKGLKDILENLTGSVTNKKNLPAMESMEKFNEKLLDKLPAELTSVLPVDAFAVNYTYLDVNEDAGARLKKIKDNKKSSGVVLDFDASAVQAIQAGTRLALKIQKVLYKDFTEGGKIPEAQARKNKEAAIEEQFGEQIRAINRANPVALAMILDAAIEVVMENPQLLEGFLRTLEAQSNMGQSWRGLTGFAEFEVHGKSQGVYVNTETNDFYGKALTKKQRKLKEEGIIVVNKEHPNYKAAIRYIKENNKPELDKSGNPTVVNLMNFKGEHLMPSAQVWFSVGKVAIQAAANAKKYPNAIDVAKAQAKVSIRNEIRGFDQQLNSVVLSKLQDDKMGATNKSGYFRLLSLNKNQQDSFVSIDEVGMRQTNQKLAQKIRELAKSHEGYVAAISNDKTINEAASKLSISQEQDMSKAINDMIERTKGVQSEKVFSAVQAKKRGKIIGKYKFFSPAADDFRGLTSYTFAGKGKQGEADQKFFEEKLTKPYQRGINAIDVAKQTLKNDFTAVVKAFAPQAKVMKKKIPGSDYTYDQAIRVYMWTRQGTEVPGMSKRDLALLNKTVAEDPAMIAFADAMLLVSKQGEWMAPGEHWLTNTVLSDLNNMSEKIGRKVYLEEFLTNKDIIFSPENMAKIEAIYGSKYISALKDSLYRMENGTNRPSGEDATTNRWLNWINQSTGAIMFFNRRSAALQLLSTVNFINWSDNNPVKAAIAFANQKQFWTDFSMLFNSPKLKQRRAGLKTDVSQAEIANAVAGQTNKAAAVLNYLLKIGFTPTQIADSFAIASGGASFYRNRVNTYIKQGKSQKEAETLAFEEFSSTADESQQSSDPMLISQQQATMLGRLVLAFQNTTMQFSRLMKKSTLDLINGRGDPKTHISKIIYYGAVQNFVFSALQSALFSFIPGFGDDDEYDESKTREEKLEGATGRIINGMIDSVLRGTGLTGAVIANHIYTFLAVLSIMPPVGSKFSKLYKAQQTKTFEKDALEARPFGIVADGRVNLGPGYRIVGNLAAATFSIPGDRIVDEVTSISEALDARNSQWQRLALAIGYKAWAVGAKNEEHDLLKAEGKVRRKAEGKVKSAETRAANKETERERIANMSPAERSKYEEQKVLDKIARRIKRLENR